jgi:hypothetical protein
MMIDEERAALQAARDVVDSTQDAPILEDNDTSASLGAWQALDGSVPVDISHAGGELRQILQDDTDNGTPKVRRVDPRTRRDRTELRTYGFEQQIEGIVGGYLLWHASLGTGGYGSPICAVPDGAKVHETRRLLILDTYGVFRISLCL